MVLSSLSDAVTGRAQTNSLAPAKEKVPDPVGLMQGENRFSSPVSRGLVTDGATSVCGQDRRAKHAVLRESWAHTSYRGRRGTVLSSVSSTSKISGLAAK